MKGIFLKKFSFLLHLKSNYWFLVYGCLAFVLLCLGFLPFFKFCIFQMIWRIKPRELLKYDLTTVIIFNLPSSISRREV